MHTVNKHKKNNIDTFYANNLFMLYNFGTTVFYLIVDHTYL